MEFHKIENDYLWLVLKIKILILHFPNLLSLQQPCLIIQNLKLIHIIIQEKKGFEFVSNPKNINRARVNNDIIRTQKANQQFNWNGDFVFESLNEKKHNDDILKRAYVGIWKGKQGVIRQLSHRECLRLMGFLDSFKIVVPNIQIYRQAGNSIVVNVLEEIIKEIFKVENLYEKN